MKINGRNIKRRLYGIRRWTDRLSRAKYFRGHGVHSPFVYAIVREVFMTSEPISDDRSVYDALMREGVAERRAMQLQNLYTHCRYGSFELDSVREGVDMSILTGGYPSGELAAAAAAARLYGSTLVIMSPCDGDERERACRAIVAAHRCTTVDNRAYLLIFNNRLPKQHFRL